MVIEPAACVSPGDQICSEQSPPPARVRCCKCFLAELKPLEDTNLTFQTWQPWSLCKEGQPGFSPFHFRVGLWGLVLARKGAASVPSELEYCRHLCSGGGFGSVAAPVAAVPSLSCAASV